MENKVGLNCCAKLSSSLSHHCKKTAGRIPQIKGVRCYSPLAMGCKKWILPASIRDCIPYVILRDFEKGTYYIVFPDFHFGIKI